MFVVVFDKQIRGDIHWRGRRIGTEAIARCQPGLSLQAWMWPLTALSVAERDKYVVFELLNGSLEIVSFQLKPDEVAAPSLVNSKSPSSRNKTK